MCADWPSDPSGETTNHLLSESVRLPFPQIFFSPTFFFWSEGPAGSSCVSDMTLPQLPRLIPQPRLGTRK